MSPNHSVPLPLNSSAVGIHDCPKFYKSHDEKHISTPWLLNRQSLSFKRTDDSNNSL